MKNTILCLLLLLATNVNARFCQVVYISPTSDNLQKESGFYEFENADVKVFYSFWAESGLMGFMVYNKTSKPIYIDWKKSAMIYNGRQNPYYTNKTTSNYYSYGVGYGFDWASIFCNNVVSASIGVSAVHATETIVKQERLTFIPPHSYVSNAFYNILAQLTSFTIDKHKNKAVEIHNKEVYEAEPHNSFVFRNFLTYSNTEDFASESYIDNEFSISRIITMHDDDFGRKNIEGKYSNVWAKPTRFYISDIKREDVFE